MPLHNLTTDERKLIKQLEVRIKAREHSVQRLVQDIKADQEQIKADKLQISDIRRGKG